MMEPGEMKSDPHFNVMPVGRKMRYIFFLFFLPSVLQPLAFVCVCVSSFFFSPRAFVDNRSISMVLRERCTTS